MSAIAELPVAMHGLQPTISAKIDGKPAVLLADSGAFFSMVSDPAAKRFGLRSRDVPQGFYLEGAVGGVAPGLGAAETFELAGAVIRNVEFLVGGSQEDEVDGLLGQNVLGSFTTEYDLANGVIRLWKVQGCADAFLAYWAKDTPVSVLKVGATTPLDPHIVGEAQVNGRSIRVLFDTGAGRSGLALGAAQRIGLNLDDPAVRAGGVIHGVGPRETESWIVPVTSFALADEIIKNTRLRVARTTLSRADMLLGADFFLSHRVLVAPDQRKVYFSYNGGPVFRLEADPRAPHAAPPPEPAASAQASAAPLNADALTRRAKASLARLDYSAAIADFSRALDLEPNDAQLYYDRARARMEAGEGLAVMADLDAAIRLKPGFGDALLMRGAVRLRAGQDGPAEADFEAAMKASSEDPQVGEAIASLYADAGQFERAVARYDQLIAAQPKNSGLLNQRCWARALWGRELDQALADCDAAIRIGPRRASYFDSRGLAHLRRGELDLAIADYDAALKLQPKTAWSLFGRGLATAAKGDAQGALADLNAAETLQPGLQRHAQRFGITPQTVAAARRR